MKALSSEHFMPEWLAAQFAPRTPGKPSIAIIGHAEPHLHALLAGAVTEGLRHHIVVIMEEPRADLKTLDTLCPKVPQELLQLLEPSKPIAMPQKMDLMSRRPRFAHGWHSDR